MTTGGIDGMRSCALAVCQRLFALQRAKANLRALKKRREGLALRWGISDGVFPLKNEAARKRLFLKNWNWR